MLSLGRIAFAGGMLVLSLFLGSCAARTAAVDSPPVPQVEQPPPPDYTALYVELETRVLEYREGIALLAGGEEILAEDKLIPAANAIAAGADLCARSSGCEMDRYLAAFQRLLNEQGNAIKIQAFRIETLESSAEEDLEREPGTTSFVQVIPELGRAASFFRGTDLREMIQLNEPVKAAIDDWLTWMRPMLMAAHQNYMFLRDKMAPVYEQAGFPEAILFAMLATESGGKVHSYSRAGAAGPLQFMRLTGRKYGLHTVDGFDMRLDPESATRANVAYISDRLEELNDDLEKALAAYNGGESRMVRLDRKFDGASLWDRRFYYSLPRETREYVPRILAAAWLFLHPEEYNLDFGSFDYETAPLTLRAEIAIGELSICFGQERNRDGWFRTLRNLNPRIGPGDRIPAGSTIEVPAHLGSLYEERCLAGEHLERARALHDANYPEGEELIPYVVRRGDTLSRIASRHRCVSLVELADINRIRAPRYTIRVGQELKIPGCS